MRKKSDENKSRFFANPGKLFLVNVSNVSFLLKGVLASVTNNIKDEGLLRPVRLSLVLVAICLCP